MTPPEPPLDPATLVLEVRGKLDRTAGRTLLAAVRAAVERHPSRLEIDLQSLEAFTPEGLEALSECSTYRARFPGGLHVRTMGDVAREAFLTAFA